MKTVDTLTELNHKEFNKSYFNQKPVIKKGGIKDTASYKLWSLDYLKSKIGSSNVTVNYSESGEYNYSIKGRVQQITGPFDQIIDSFISGSYVNKSYYLQQLSIAANFPQLLNDLENPDLNADTDLVEVVNLWVGGGGCVTSLHFDASNNFLAQVRGKKEITFFAPEDTVYLYANQQPGMGHISGIELDRVNLERFPLFSNAQPYYCLLEEGDYLYIPPGWWHHVRSKEVAVSVNYWWSRFDISDGNGIEFLSVEQLCGMIRLFLAKGLSINHADENGEPLLIKAICKGYANVVEAFLLMGADPDQESVQFKPGTPAIILAADHDQIINLLLHYGAVKF